MSHHQSYISLYRERQNNPNNVIDLNNLCGNGFLKNIRNMYKWKSRRRKSRVNYVSRAQVLIPATKRFCGCIVPAGTVGVDCHRSNVIYLITCNKCYRQYIDQTVQKLNERFNGHRTGFEHPDKHRFCKILSRNFHDGNCKDASCDVQILERLEDNGRTSKNILDVHAVTLRSNVRSTGY